jgi:hypothetical protein
VGIRWWSTDRAGEPFFWWSWPQRDDENGVYTQCTWMLMWWILPNAMAHEGWCYYQTLRWMLVDEWCHFLPWPPMWCAELLFGSAEKWHLWLHHHGHDQIGAAKRNLAFPNVELVTAYASIDPAFAPGSWAFLSRGREPLDVKYLKYLEFVMKRCAMCRLACIGLPSSTA